MGRPVIIAFEGHDGAGKSLCQSTLAAELQRAGQSVSCFDFHGQWYSKAIIRHVTDAGLMNRIAISTALAITFVAAVEQALMCDTQYVIFHRYKYTGLLKDYLRRIPSNLSNANYALVPDADVLLFLEVDPVVALHRINAVRSVSFYETGLLYTEGEELAAYKRRYDEKQYTDELLARSFLEQKLREDVFWKERIFRRPECHRICAEAAPDEVASEAMRIVREQLRQ